MQKTGYKISALTISPTGPLSYLRVTVAVAYICGILISPRLWFGLGRSFPRLPLVSGTPALPWPVECLLSILLLTALTLSLFRSRPCRCLVVVVTLTALLVLFDLTRLQPWVYQYVLMLAVLAQIRPVGDSPEKAEAATPILAACQIIVACLYFWSGAQKLNWTFGHEVMPGLLESAGIQVPAAYLTYLPTIGIAVAVIETLIGIGLLIRRTRPTAVILALGMHLLVLLMLVVAWRNSVVWPWNVAMMVMVVLLFRRCDRSLARNELWRWRASDLVSHLPKAVIVICGFAPALSFAGWWDTYLSGALYSGNTPVAVMRISDPVRERLPAVAQRQTFRTGRGEVMLPFYEWSMADLNVPPYPETRAYQRLAHKMCSLVAPEEIELIVKGRPSLIEGNYKVSRFTCRELLATRSTD